LKETWIDFTAGSGGVFNAPVAGNSPENMGTAVCLHGCEYYGHREARIGAKDELGGVVAEEITAEDGERGIVERRVGIGCLVYEASGESFKWKSR
jgi:hypothetical protein